MATGIPPGRQTIPPLTVRTRRQLATSVDHFNLEGPRDPERVDALPRATQQVKGELGLEPWFLISFFWVLDTLTGGKQLKAKVPSGP